MKTKKLLSILTFIAAATVSCADDVTTPFEAPMAAPLASVVAAPLSLVELTDSIPESWAYAQVDAKGGKVYDDKNGNEIRVMRGAVTEPTIFLMHTLPGRKMVVDLTAWRKIDGTWTQIHEFSRESIKLRLSYARTAVKQPNRLRVVYIPNPEDLTVFEPLATEIYKSEKQAQGKLSHFSVYSMAID